MGDEYKPGPTKFTFDPVENWNARAGGIPDALEAAIENKLAKRYSSPFWLVGWRNSSTRDRTRDCRHQATLRAIFPWVVRDLERQVTVNFVFYSNTCTTSEAEITPPAAMTPATARRGHGVQAGPGNGNGSLRHECPRPRLSDYR